MELNNKIRKTKICYVATISLTIKAFFLSQLQYLSARGFDVTVVCSYDETLQAELGEDIHFKPIQMPRGVSLMGSYIGIKHLFQFFKSEQFDLIQYSTPNASLYAAVAGKLARIKIRNYHLMGFRYLGASGVGRIILKTIEKLICSLSTTIECVSNSNLKLGVKDNVFLESKACVVWNGSSGGVDLRRFDFTKREQWRKEVRIELGYSEEDFVFGFVGRITADKGINELLEAFCGLTKGSKLLLIGDLEGEDTLDAALVKKARENKDILFHKKVFDIERYYAALDMLVLPSYREGFGNVVIEAAAMGTPAIVSNIPGPIDAIDIGNTAITIPVKDAEKLRRAMQKCECGNIKFASFTCMSFVRNNFDSETLNKYIYERKKYLLEAIKLN